jgi:outer membrane protein assembly factor BamA
VAADAPFPRIAGGRARSALLLAAPAVLCAAPQGAPSAPGPLSLEFTGGTADDRAFARAAAGRVRNPGELDLALEAIRATDRFQVVEAMDPRTAPAGAVGIRLVPWPRLLAWTVQDDGPQEGPPRRRVFPEVRTGVRAGLLRREAWRDRAEQVLRASGFPSATVAVQASADGTRLVFDIRRGAPARIRSLVLEGNAAPYGEAKLWKLAGAEPGRTLWTLTFRREALARLRKRFLKDRRYEWRAEFQYQEDGTLRLQVDPGPLVDLRAEGASLGFGGIAELAPLARAERYGHELLDEGDRRIYRHLQQQGHLDPAVAHRREVVAGTEASPERVRITYEIRPGPKVVVAGLRFAGNESIGERELLEAAGLPPGWIRVWGVPKASPEMLAGLEDRILAHYLLRGFSEVEVRRQPPVLEQGRWIQGFTIQEGPRRTLRELRLHLPRLASADPWPFAEDLLGLLGDPPVRRRAEEPPGGLARTFEGDRPTTAAVVASLELEPGAEGTAVRLRPRGALPYVKGDLVLAVARLRARFSGLGVQRPRESLAFEEGEDGALSIRIDIPEAPTLEVRRLVVQGSDRTRARAVLREAELDPGKPLSPEGLGSAQARIANLGAFQRVDLEGLPGREEGSLALRLSERSPWIFSHSFGYDRSQGYHIGTGVQRLNVAGMGRSIDFGIRAGDATLNSQRLRWAFPTGEFSRSVDNYSLGYTDPRFSPALLDAWLPDRVQYRAEAAYTVERQTVYEIRRRRILNDFSWHLGAQKAMQVGHRFERAEVVSRIVPVPEIADKYENDLFKAAKIPDGRVIISAPYVQFIRDTRDSPLDPTRGTLLKAKMEFANQVFGTSTNSSFVKLDLRHQWNWALGHNAERGVATLGLRVGIAHPTAASSENFPLSERFFAGGPFTHRGVEPDALGPRGSVPILDPVTRNYKYSETGNPLNALIPLGGQALALVNLEYRFPVLSSWFWGEVFLDSGQVYGSLNPKTEPLIGAPPHFPPFRTSLGAGLIFKLGVPVKIEYAVNVKRLLGRERTREEHETDLTGVFVSAGFQF